MHGRHHFSIPSLSLSLSLSLSFSLSLSLSLDVAVDDAPFDLCFCRWAGPAAFSRKFDKDPWNPRKDLCEGQQCATFMGGTEEYFSPQQTWLLKQSRSLGRDDWVEIETRWQITPATSDLYQSALTMLEAHARYLPQTIDTAPSDAVMRCAARTPDVELERFSPEQTELWLVEKKIQLQPGSLVATGISGARLLELARAGSHKYLMVEFGLKTASSKKIQNAIRRNISTPADAIVHEKVGAVLVKCLDWDVGKRYSTASEVLKVGLGAGTRYDSSKGMHVLDDITKAVGGWLLPRAAHEEKSSNHSGAIVDATLGGLVKRLVEFDDAQGARDACAEWIGEASDDSRANAISVYCEIWQHFGGEWSMCDLSRNGRSHWHDDMLSGDGTLRGLANSLSTAAASLEQIDLSEQKKLEGGVLEILLEKGRLPKLRKINLSGCRKATCAIPPSITECSSLATLDLRGCGREGECHNMEGKTPYIF